MDHTNRPANAQTLVNLGPMHVWAKVEQRLHDGVKGCWLRGGGRPEPLRVVIASMPQACARGGKDDDLLNLLIGVACITHLLACLRALELGC